MPEITFDVSPVALEGAGVRLEPLHERHLPELYELGREAAVWDYLSGAPFECEADAAAWLRKAMGAQRSGSEVPFAVIDRGSERVAGSTRYADIRRPHRALEVGSTWYGSAFRRTHVNTETKILLMTHAFERLGAVRVQFLTDARNHRSQKALDRLGVVREGVLRRHKVCSDGFIRDSVVYSATCDDWPHVKARLQALLRRGSQRPFQARG